MSPRRLKDMPSDESTLHSGVNELLEMSSGGVSGVFDRAFDLYKRHAVRFMFIASLVLIPTAILLSLMDSWWLQGLEVRLNGDGSEGNFALLGQFLFVVLFIGSPRSGVPGLISLGAFLCMSIPITLLASGLVTGNRTSLRRSLKYAIRRLPSLLFAFFAGGLAFGAVLTITVSVSVLLFVLFLIGVNQVGQNSVEGGILVFFGVVVFPYVLSCAVWARSFALAVPLIVLEKCSIRSLPERNRQLLVALQYKRIGLAIALVPVLIGGMNLLMVTMLDSLLSQFPVSALVRFWLQNVVFTGINLLLQPYAALFFVLLYFQAAFRRDGLDIRVLALGSGLAAPSDAYRHSPNLATPLKRVVPLLCLIVLGCLSGARGMAQANSARTDNPTQVRQNLKHILSQEEFQATPTVQNNPLQSASTWLRERWDQFWTWFRGLFKMLSSPSAGPALQWLFIVLFLIFGTWLAVRVMRHWGFSRRMTMGDTPIPREFAEALEGFDSAEEWLAKGRGLAESGDYRQAYRAVFFAALMRVHEQGWVSYSRFRPNGDYLHGLRARNHGAVLEALHPLVATFDRVWYGGQDASVLDYEFAVKRVERLETLSERVR